MFVNGEVSAPRTLQKIVVSYWKLWILKIFSYTGDFEFLLTFTLVQRIYNEFPLYWVLWDLKISPCIRRLLGFTRFPSILKSFKFLQTFLLYSDCKFYEFHHVLGLCFCNEFSYSMHSLGFSEFPTADNENFKFHSTSHFMFLRVSIFTEDLNCFCFLSAFGNVIFYQHFFYNEFFYSSLWMGLWVFLFSACSVKTKYCFTEVSPDKISKINKNKRLYSREIHMFP